MKDKKEKKRKKVRKTEREKERTQWEHSFDVLAQIKYNI